MKLRNLYIACYAAAGILFLLVLVYLAGVYTSALIKLVVMVGWVAICFTGNRWTTGLFLSNQRIRKTILEEEEWLHPLLHELNLRTGKPTMPELFILETPEPDAYAAGRNTIVLSRGLLVKLSEPEIKAVLAHEYGHLKSGDTFAATAFALASAIPVFLFNWLHHFTKGSRRKTRSTALAMVTLTGALVILGFHFPNLILLMLILFIFRKGFPYVHSAVMMGWTYFTREDEYKQDRFAQSLGCGRHLKSALLKIDSLASDNLITPAAQRWASHPMLYARVRRLEWLDGLRTTP
jgi:heat shock protein HtpX